MIFGFAFLGFAFGFAFEVGFEVKDTREARTVFLGRDAMQKNEQGEREMVSKFSRQAADLGAVFIYKEGLFARAYNEGAYGFIHHVMECKPLRRFVKSAGEDRVVCGVPLTVLAKLPGFGQASQLDALTWRWPLVTPVDLAQYEVWRESLPLMLIAKAAKAVESTPPVVDLAQRLIEQLIRFNVAASTPVAALNLVADLQRQWRESEVN